MEIYTEGNQTFSAMLDAIDRAEKIIRFETYIFASDNIGWDFAHALVKKAQQGVTVKVLVDAAGTLFYSDKKLFKHLKENEIQLKLFHRWSFRHPFRYNRRNHRKVLLIDNKEAFLGGFNIHDENSPKYHGDQAWRDTHAHFQGELIPELIEHFNASWNEKPKTDFDIEQLLQLQMGQDFLAPGHIRKVNHAMWKKAEKYIYLTTPYLVPDLITQKALIEAAERGIDVRVLLPEKDDIKMTRWAARAAYANLLHGGVRIFEYEPRMLHSKTFVMDDTWCSVGTANLDYRSLFFNYELNLFSRKPIICQTLKDQFLTDLKQSKEVNKSRWPDRPWSERLTEFIGWIARRWL